MNEVKPQSETVGFLNRTIRNLKRGWQTIAGTDYTHETASLRPDLPADDAKALRAQMTECLENKGGDVSARGRAAALGQVYLALDAQGRERFLRLMAENFGVDEAAVNAAITEHRRAADDEARIKSEGALRKALEAPWKRLLTQFNALPDGVKFLVDLRAELLPLARKDPLLKSMETDLREILTSWFDVDFLELTRMTWDSSSAAVLEKLIEYEAVHAIKGWEDLKDRLDSDRRCFGYFHPRMPHEPLIFVEVALVNGIADNVQTLLDRDAPVMNPDVADTAIFYSISNAQQGLAGISFGNFLIKRVAGSLAAEFPNLKTFATLSPVPGFRKWLDGALADGEPNLLTAAERKALVAACGLTGGAKGALRTALERDDWRRDDGIKGSLETPLKRLVTRYLTEAKGRGGRALDPVAHFHQTNGARLERVNWMGDTSANGMRQSAGIMVNYLYDLGRIEANHEAYTATGEVNASTAVKGLLKT